MGIERLPYEMSMRLEEWTSTRSSLDIVANIPKSEEFDHKEGKHRPYLGLGTWKPEGSRTYSGGIELQTSNLDWSWCWTKNEIHCVRHLSSRAPSVRKNNVDGPNLSREAGVERQGHGCRKGRWKIHRREGLGIIEQSHGWSVLRIDDGSCWESFLKRILRRRPILILISRKLLRLKLSTAPSVVANE